MVIYHLIVDKTTANILIQANNRFYAQQALSFGKTRQNSWPGWQRVVETALVDPSPDVTVHVLDLACGNKRFETYLEQRCPEISFAFLTIDNAPFDDCEALASPVTHQHIDVLATIAGGKRLNLGSSNQLSVSFGFMHHIPGQKLRKELLLELLQATAPGGHVAVSFWRFLDNPSLAKQANDAFSPACAALAPFGLDPENLDSGDAFLGWDGKDDAWRYCHSFADAEIDQLIASVEDDAEVVDRFRSDGRSQDLNEYVILKRR